MNLTGKESESRLVDKAAGGDVADAVARAMAGARNAQARWSGTPLARRLELIRRLRRLVADHASQLAEASAAARRRPALESLTAEVLPFAEACRFLEREAARILATRVLGGSGLPLWTAGVRGVIHREPLGVVLIIGPANYPLFLPGVQTIQALVAGNAVLLKPGVGGTPAAEALRELVVRAGFEKQLVGLLPESVEAARAALMAHPDKVLFTGSASTGQKILAQAAPGLIPATLELSGCNAVVVRADADLDVVVRALLFGVMLNAGATCLSPRRVFVPRGIATELEGRLAKAFGGRSSLAALSLATGAGESPVEIAGRRQLLPSEPAQKPSEQKASPKVWALVEDAIGRGAHFIAGEIREDGSMTAPVVLGGVLPASLLLREDLFAPVLAVVAVTDDQEAVFRANDCPFALGAGVFSRDESAARDLASRINTGVVTINDLIIPTADARVPFGGHGRSGFGVTRGAEGLLELTRPKVVTVSRGRFRPAFDPAQPGDEEIITAYLRLTHGRGVKARGKALVSLARNICRRSSSSRTRIP